MKHQVMLYTERYELIEVEANTIDEAEDMVLTGNYEDSQIIDITVENSEIIEGWVE